MANRIFELPLGYMDGIRRTQRKNHSIYPKPASAPVRMPQKEAPLPKADLRDLARSLSSYRTHEERKNGKKSGKLAFSFLLLFLLSAFSYGSFMLFKTHQASRKTLSLEKEQPTLLEEARSLVLAQRADAPKLPGEKEGRINILLLGAAGEGKPGTNLTDTIMIASLSLKEKRIALISLPRDLYVEIPQEKRQSKLNTLYQYGLSSGKNLEPITQAVSEITGLPLHYYLVVDFEGFEKMIDALGGIRVMVERDIYDTRYPGPNYSYETFSLKKGLHELDGKTALKYVRERHSDPEGDFGRAKRQQQALQAIKGKVFSIGTILNASAMSELLNALGSHVRTNLRLEEMLRIAALSKELDTQNISTAVVDAWKRESLLRVSHVELGGSRAFILIPRSGNWHEIKDLAANIFDRAVLQKRAAEIAKEKPRVLISYSKPASAAARRIQDLLRQRLGEESTIALRQENSQSSPKTRIWDHTNGSKIYSADEMVKTLGASLERNEGSDDETTKYDFLLLVGTETEEILSFEEDSMEDLAKEQGSALE